MADPLQRDEVREFEVTDTATPVSPDERSGANRVPLHDPTMAGTMNPDRQLDTDFRANQRLNRTAESIGGALGRAVSQARRMPDSARRGLHVVRDRASAAGGDAADSLSASASSLADSARQKAGELRVTAEQRGRELRERAGELGETISSRAAELGDNVQRQAGELKRQVEARTRELRAEVRLKAQEARLRGKLLVRERPFHALGGIAAAGFATGVLLRIVRSRNARHY
jgi:ElaB/YqjD/DUF883 family membrane-anchored ribosome-binding protein